MTTHRIAAVGLAVLLVGGTVAPAAAAGSPVSYACRVDTPLGEKHLTLQENVRAWAPKRVLAGAVLPIVVDLEPGSVPSEVRGIKLREIRDLALRFRIPANSRYVSARLDGGAVLGSAPALEVAGGVATVKVPGPIAGGAGYELPRLTVWLVAGRSGTIESRLHGTGFGDAGLTLTAVVKTPFGGVDAPAACFPDPSPVLTRTAISS